MSWGTRIFGILAALFLVAFISFVIKARKNLAEKRDGEDDKQDDREEEQHPIISLGECLDEMDYLDTRGLLKWFRPNEHDCYPWRQIVHDTGDPNVIIFLLRRSPLSEDIGGVAKNETLLVYLGEDVIWMISFHQGVVTEVVRDLHPLPVGQIEKGEMSMIMQIRERILSAEQENGGLDEHHVG